MSQIITTSTQESPVHTRNQRPSTAVRTVHIDRIHVNGPLDHKPLGELFYKAVDEETVTPVGASAFKPNSKSNPDEVYIRSREVQKNERAYKLEIDCCPPKILQGHNFFGHGDLLDYTYAMFDRQTRKFGLPVDPIHRNLWRTGKKVGVTGVHLCANFWCQPGMQLPFINGIDNNNQVGKHRDYETCITLGFTPNRRSVHHMATAYAKGVLLHKEWKRPGPLQARITRASDRSFRIEIKLYSQWLTENDLGLVTHWKDVDVNETFFELLARYNIANTFQPLMTEDERLMLSNSELRAYMLWLNGSDLKDYFSRTTVWKYTTDILKKTGVDMRANRRPEPLPIVDLREILVPENIVPIPDWAYENPARYWAPGPAFLGPGDDLDAWAY